jgi:rhamnose transport system substrate-binding protein
MAKKYTVLSILLITVLALVLGGCVTQPPAAPAGETSSESAAEEEAAESSEAADEEAAEVPSDEPLEIVYIPKNTGNPYFDSIIGGFEEACEEVDCNFTTVAPATAEATSQVPFIQEQIQRGVDVIAIAPNSPDALNDLFDEAREAGILVMVVNSDIPGSEEHRDVAILPTNFDKLGAEQVELMGSLIDYEGDIAILSATADAPDQNYWIEGMKEALESDPKYADMNLVEVVYGDDDPQKSLTECEALISRYPDLRGIIAPTTVGVAAAAQCVESAGLYPEGPNATVGLQVTGLGTPDQMRRFVKDGVVDEFALWDPAIQGVIATHLAEEVLKEGATLEEGLTFDAGRVGEITVGENGVIIAGPPQVFDPENIDDFSF